MSDSVMRVRLQSDQVSLLMDLADSRLAAFAIRFMSDNEVEIQRAQANQIREELGAELMRRGFGDNYELSAEGKLIESVIDALEPF